MRLAWLFRAMYVAGLVAEVVVRAPYERQHRQTEKTDRRVTAAEQVVLGWLFVTMGCLPMLASLTPWLQFADVRLVSWARVRLGALGTLLLAAAVGVFWRAHRDLGANWSPSLEIQAEQTLVTGGIYGIVRHPMYTSQWLWGLAQPLLLPNWVAGFGTVTGFLALYLVRVPAEERLMLDHFGEAYRAYCARTGRVLPALRS